MTSVGSVVASGWGKLRRLVFGSKSGSVPSFLTGRYRVSLRIDGSPAPVESGGKLRPDFDADWGPAATPEAIGKFLSRFRADPRDTRPDPAIRAALHHFLFAGNTLAAPVAAQGPGLATVLVGGAHGEPLLANIPWELADGLAEAQPSGARRPLLGTLGMLPLARVVQGARSGLKPGGAKRRLTVAYCISEPADDPFGGEGFFDAIEATLRRRPGVLTYRKLGSALTTRVHELLAGIEKDQPHVLIVVCHGRTTNGTPELRFDDWTSVRGLGDAIALTGQTLLVLLIACDQTHLEETPSAHSGALTLLDAGVPAVVAMQSSVNARLAAEFLGTTLDWLLQSASLPQCVAAGRRRMAPGTDAETSTDWAFPTLFVAEDGHRQLQRLTEYIEGYVPALKTLLRGIPAEPAPYFPRPGLEEWLASALHPDNRGVRAIVGPAEQGKSTLVRYVCRRALASAIERNDLEFRHILYVDLAPFQDPLETPQDLLGILASRTDELLSGLPSTVFEWPKPRSPDGQGLPSASMEPLMGALDANHMVLVLDNLPLAPVWSEFVQRSRDLNHSLVVVVAQDAAKLPVDDLYLGEVLPLSESDVHRYAREFVPGYDPDEIYALAGGAIMLLDQLRRLQRQSYPFAEARQLLQEHPLSRGYAQAMLDPLMADEKKTELLYRLVHLPSGINGHLAGQYVGEWRDLLDLERSNLLIRDYRAAQDDPWLRLPHFVAAALREFRGDEVRAAGKAVVDAFREDVRPDVEARLEELARAPGGVDLLHDLHQTLVGRKEWPMARAMALLLHATLYQRGRWFDSARFWTRYLTHAPRDETLPHDWLKLAKAAHLLGEREKAVECLDVADQLGPEPLDSIEILDLHASLIKDTGATERVAEVLDLYDVAMELIEEGRASPAAGQDAAPFEQAGANLLYNRAILRRWWTRDVEGALDEMRQAQDRFEALGMRGMHAVARSEWVDMRMAVRDPPPDWNGLVETLLQVDDELDAAGSPGDRAICNLRLGRLYRRMPFRTDEERRDNLLKAEEAFETAEHLAVEAGDARLRRIIEVNLVEVAWRDRGAMPDDEAARRLDSVIRILELFSGDAWSMRVLRDALLLRAGTARRGLPDEVRSWLEKGWRVATSPPLHPRQGTDARRAAQVLCEYLGTLTGSGDLLAVEKLGSKARPFVEGWLAKPVDLRDRATWLGELCRFGTSPGEYHG